MHIGFIGSKGLNVGGTAFGGYETVITELGPRLVQAGHDVTVYARRRLYGGKVLPDTYRGVRLRPLGSIETKNIGTMSNSLLALLAAIRDRVDVVVFVNVGLGVYLPIAKAAGLGVVTFLDGVEWRRAKWGRLARLTFRLGAAMNVRLADRLVADGFAMQHIYTQEFGREPDCITYGVEVRPPSGDRWIKQYGLACRGYNLLATRFVPENNAHLIVSAYQHSSSKVPLVVLGQNYYASEYESRVRSIKDDRIKFLGQVHDRECLYEFYQNCRAYLHGHSAGGTNPTLLEALANGCCIIALDTPFNREVLSEGECGILVGNDEIEWRRALELLDKGDSGLETLRTRALERARAAYDWGPITKQYVSLLEQVQKGARSRHV